MTLHLALPLADVSLPFRDVLGAALRVIDERRELLFLLLQLGFVLFEPLKQGGDIALRARDALFRASDNRLGELQLPCDADPV